MIGLIVKSAAALFVEGADPGPALAVALINHHRAGTKRAFAERLGAVNLKLVPRPAPLSRQSFDWAYVFVGLTETATLRLEPGPFDSELTEIVRIIEAEKPTRTLEAKGE